MINQPARKILIANAVAAGSEDRRPLRWRGEDRPFPVVSIPVSAALLNPRSHRIKAQVQSLGKRGQIIQDDPFGPEAQDLVAEIIRKTPKYPRIVGYLRKDGQRDSGVITSEGVLVNANTRLVALRELGLEYLKVQVLPTDATASELTKLELSFQMEPDSKQDYSFTNELIFIQDLLNEGWSPRDIGLEMYRDLDERKDADRRIAAQKIETEARLLQILETILAAGRGAITYEFFDNEQQNLRDIDSAYEAMRKKDPDVAERVRDAKIAGMLAGLDYRRVREIDEIFLSDYVLHALEEEESLKPYALDLATGAAKVATGDDLDGLDVLDALGDGGHDMAQVTLRPIYEALAATPEDGDVMLPQSSSSEPRSMPKRAFRAAVETALVVGLSNKDRDSRGQDELTSPMKHLSLAAASCDRAREVVTKVVDHHAFDKRKMQIAFEDYLRAHDELVMVVEQLGLRPDEDGDQ